MMGAKAELERELIFCKARIEALEEQLKAAGVREDTMLQQMEKMQEALISIRAPDAYRDQQIAKEEPRPPVSDAFLERNRIMKEVTEKYLASMEGPTFRTGDDLDDLLRTGIIRETSTTPSSIHGNDES